MGSEVAARPVLVSGAESDTDRPSAQGIPEPQPGRCLDMVRRPGIMERMEWVAIGLALLFALLGLGCLLLTAIGLPGTWLMIALAAGIHLLQEATGSVGAATSAWWTIGVCVALAGVGEVIETLAGAAGTHAGGGTSRGMVGAILGGIVGGIVLTPVIPIPLVGTLLGAMIGTFAGALAGEMTGEAAGDGGDSVKAAFGATVGRLLGSMGKTLVAAVAWVLLTFRLFAA